MSRYYDYTNGISWQNQSMGGGQGVGGQKDSGRPQPPMYTPHPAYTSVAQDSRLPINMNQRASALYAQSMYHQYQQQQAKPQGGGMNNYAVLPDVKMKRLPFYDIMGEIMKPSSLLPTSTTQRLQEAMFSFYLTPQQATSIATGRDYVGFTQKIDNVVQVQLRFCQVETTSEQEDYFPPSCTVKVNGKMCPLPSPIPTNKPGVEPKRPPRPVNITALIKISPTVANTLTINWATDFTKNYAISVTLVKKLISTELLSRLKNKGTKPSDYTRSLIKEKLREDLDSEIATTSLRVSLVCPLGKMRMICPCRPSTCLHLQCFDASLFLQMNERKPTWVCPVCDKPALYDTLVVDGYFQEVLNSSRLGADCCEVELHNDGAWSAHVTKKDSDSLNTPMKEDKSKVEVISDDLEVIPLSDGIGNKNSRDDSAKTNGNGTASGGSTSPESTTTMIPASSTSPSTPNNGAAASTGGFVDLTSDDEEDVPLKRKTPTRQLEPSPSFSELPKYNDVTSSGYTSPGAAAPPYTPTSSVPPAIISLDSPSPPPAVPSPPASAQTGPPLAHQASMARTSMWTPSPQHRY